MRCWRFHLCNYLILNHLIVLYNIFGINATKMIFYKLDEDYYSYIKPFLILLGHMPEIIIKEDKSIRNSDIPLDSYIVKVLRNI